MDLSGHTNEALSRLVANCIYEVVTEGKRAAGAKPILEAAYPEIERRLAGQDETGLLAALGYHTGYRDPVPENRRHAILRWVFCAPLPGIRRKGYMERWGEPLSEQRHRQIEAMLRWFIDRHAGDPLMGRACAEWRTDLRHVSDGYLAASER